jgi:uncharacterized membrane protein
VADGRQGDLEGDAFGSADDRRRSLEREQNALEALQIQVESRWEGPMPSPAILAQYEVVKEGFAERIMAMAETATTGDIRTREKLADAEIERARTGQALAFLLTLIVLGAAIYFFVAGNNIAGGILLGVHVIMLIQSFLPARGRSSS